jgi:hypothetical protein
MAIRLAGGDLGRAERVAVVDADVAPGALAIHGNPERRAPR